MLDLSVIVGNLILSIEQQHLLVRSSEACNVRQPLFLSLSLAHCKNTQKWLPQHTHTYINCIYVSVYVVAVLKVFQTPRKQVEYKWCCANSHSFSLSHSLDLGLINMAKRDVLCEVIYLYACPLSCCTHTHVQNIQYKWLGNFPQ